MMQTITQGRFPRLAYIFFGGILGVFIIATGNVTQAKPDNSLKQIEEEIIQEIKKHPSKSNDSMDKPLEFILAAVKSFENVKDYSATLFQLERIKGKLQPEASIQLVATAGKPFFLHMKWSEPRSSKGQEAMYTTTKDPSKMRVKGAGFLGAVGFITLDINDPKSTANNRHNVSEAGMEMLIKTLEHGWIEEGRRKATEVLVSDVVCYDRPCTRLELTHPVNTDGYFLFYKNIVFFDKENNLPIRIENYSWPKEGESAPLEEAYGYKDLKLNPGLDLAVFQK